MDKMRCARDILIKCGLMFDYSEMFSEDEIIKLIGGLKEKYFVNVRRFGERAHAIIGKKKTLILWDCGNGQYQIIAEE